MRRSPPSAATERRRPTLRSISSVWWCSRPASARTRSGSPGVGSPLRSRTCHSLIGAGSPAGGLAELAVELLVLGDGLAQEAAHAFKTGDDVLGAGVPLFIGL